MGDGKGVKRTLSGSATGGFMLVCKSPKRNITNGVDVVEIGDCGNVLMRRLKFIRMCASSHDKQGCLWWGINPNRRVVHVS